MVALKRIKKAKKKKKNIENNKGAAAAAASSQRRKRKKKIAKAAGYSYKKASELFMAEWWKRLLVFPVKRIWLSLYARLKSRKNKSGGILKLRDDVQTCEYEDVQVMWEMLRRSESELMDKNDRKNRPFWSVFVWSNKSHHTCSSSPTSESADQP